MLIEEYAMHRLTEMVLGLTLFVSTGCAVGPAYHRPGMELPPAFRNGAQIAGPLPSPDAEWWAGFHDPVLTKIIDRTLAQNLDLAAAAARVSEARAAAALAGAALLPNGSLETSASSSHDSLRSPIGEVVHAVGAPRNYQTYSAGAQASWDVDLFGSLRRAREAAGAEAQAVEVSQTAIRIAISAEAADAYLELRGLQAQLRLADSQEGTQSRLVELVRLRVDQGVSSDRELQRTIGEFERVRSLKPALRAAIEAIQPAAPHPAGSVTPADLIQRRPDIVVAERHLAAANARIGAAVAEYYPHVTFSGLLGFESISTGTLFTSAGQQSGVLAGLRWRLFDFGRVDAEVAIARGRDQEALAGYRAALLHATEDVEAALSRFVQSRSEAEILGRQIETLTRAREEAQTAYEGGVLPLIEVLDADRDLLDAKDRLAVANANEARAAVASFRALGGGWTG